MLQKQAVEPVTLELLNALCAMPTLKQFALGGGTNVALKFGHRLSVDLDFFTNQSFQNSIVYQSITDAYHDAELIFEQNQTMMFIINNIKVDFVLYPFAWFYPVDDIAGTRLIALEDIIPMKLQALSNRFSKKDFWDISFLMLRFSLAEMLDIFKNKFPQIDIGFLLHSLTNFETAENEEDPMPLLSADWQEIKINLQNAVRDYTQSSL